MLDTGATDGDRKLLLNLQMCNPYREGGIVLSLLLFILCQRIEIKGCDLRGDTLLCTRSVKNNWFVGSKMSVVITK